MSGREKKMVGTTVTKDEVLRELGHPSEWARDARKSEKRNRMSSQDDDLDIAGIRGYGARLRKDGGYLGFLQAQLARPDGVGTGLVSDEEDQRIRTVVIPETETEIAKYRARLEELEKSPDAVRAYIGKMRRHIEIMYLFGESDPNDEPMEELRQMAILDNQRRRLQAAIINQDIERYTKLLETLEARAKK